MAVSRSVSTIIVAAILATLTAGYIFFVLPRNGM
jgi:hypothetical protein